MKNIFIITLVIALGTLLPMGSRAQMIQDPTSWTFEAKKKSGTTYQLIFHLNLKTAGWHIWSLQPGGDGTMIAPSFTFANNTRLKLKGSVTEKGKKTTTTMEGIEGKMSYLTGKVDYIQEATISGTGKIFGSLTYQVCNDKMCLPPKDKNFVFNIK